MDLKNKDIDEVYDFLLPALEVKEINLRRNDYLGITKKDIWQYLLETKWHNKTDGHLYQMVDDIMSADNEAISRHNEY